MFKNKSYFKKSYGDEVGCVLKKGIIISINIGKVYFILWLMDVKIEGLNVVCYFDLIIYNYNFFFGNIVIWLYILKMKVVFKLGGKCVGMEYLCLQFYSKVCFSMVGGGVQIGYYLIFGCCMCGKVGYSYFKVLVICVLCGNQYQGLYKCCYVKFDLVELDYFDKGKLFKYEIVCNIVVVLVGGVLSLLCELMKKEKECVVFQFDQYYKVKFKKGLGCIIVMNFCVLGVVGKVILFVCFVLVFVGCLQELNYGKE